MVSIPRLVIAAANSSAGKTTIATGLMAALRAAGVEVAGFKVGPDFIDPGYHGLATGRPGRNLDPVLTSEELVPRLFVHGALTPRPAEIALVEGVMGLFDGQLGRDGFGSTAHVAKLLDAPVLLVVDAAGSSRTAAAAALGLGAFDPDLRVGGVILNRVGSTRHADELRAVFAQAGWPVLGAVPRSASISAPSRHLGLVPAAERAESAATIAALATHIAAHVELDAVLALASSAPELAVEPWRPTDVVSTVSGRPRIAVLAGRAFTFRYAETTELLAAAGCEVVEVDPLSDARLPDGAAGLYIGGGFPEVHAVELSRNAALRASIADAVAAGLPTVAECAGQLYLAEQLDGHPMVGVLPASARMTPRLTLGYRDTIAPADTLLARADDRVVGHEFHRTQTAPASADTAAWSWAERGEGFSLDPSGSGRPSLHASYLHLHWAGHPALAQRFAEAASRFAASLRQAQGPQTPLAEPHPLAEPVEATNPMAEPVEATNPMAEPVEATNPMAEPVEATATSLRQAQGPGPTHCSPRQAQGPHRPQIDGIDLRHHGDHDLAPGLVDLAVNVMLPGPPDWLADVLADAMTGLGSYPDAGQARAAIAAAHGVPPEMVLPTAGGAEGFALIARTLTATHPLVVHPQFTEPEAALRAAGHTVQRWLLPLQPSTPPLADLPTWADAVFVGNPTNPTGWLHSRTALLAAGAGRLLVVDEAFMDATDEAESLISPEMPDLLVLRSLSKTWGLAGLRVGYVVGDPALIARLEQAQPSWPISAPAVAAMIATSTDAARAEASARYAELAVHREHLVSSLAAAGFPTLASQAPFVLINTAACGPDSVRPALAKAGFAVRRGESFPGLDPTWIRVKVPVPDMADRLVGALAHCRTA